MRAAGARLHSVFPPCEDRIGELLRPEHLAAVDRLTAWAAERGHTVLELAVAWLLAQRPVASVIAGASAPEQVRANVAAAEWSLSRDDLAGVETALAQPGA